MGSEPGRDGKLYSDFSFRKVTLAAVWSLNQGGNADQGPVRRRSVSWRGMVLV
jgi:hypothetical protein